MATTSKHKRKDWVQQFVTAISGGVVQAVGPVLKDHKEKIADLDKKLADAVVGPTDLADLETQIGEDIKKGLEKVLK